MKRPLLLPLPLLLSTFGASCSNHGATYSSEFSRGVLQVVSDSGWWLEASETVGPNPMVHVSASDRNTVMIDFTKDGELKSITTIDFKDPLDRKTKRYIVTDGTKNRKHQMPMVQILPRVQSTTK